jgi:hypothetical protein
MTKPQRLLAGQGSPDHVGDIPGEYSDFGVEAEARHEDIRR